MDILKRTYFQTVSLTTMGVAYLIGNVHAPWTKKGLHYDDVLSLSKIIKPADVILTRTKGELTTLAIPGYWKHAAMYLGKDEFGEHRIIESVSPCVREDYLANLIMRTDCYAVMRIEEAWSGQREQMIEISSQYLGKPYDYGLDFTKKDKVSCSELIYCINNRVLGEDFIELRSRLGYPSFTPQDCYLARSKYSLVQEKRT